MKTKNNKMSFTDDYSEQVNSNDDIKLCLVCCSEVKEEQKEKDFKSGQLLSSNLNVVFLLKNILQIPDNQLIGFLKDLGDPCNWMVSLCESCKELMTKALDYHWEIIKFRKKLESIQVSIVNQIKLSTVSKKGNQLKNVSVNYSSWKKSREFIKKHDCMSAQENPFIDGDKLARSLLKRKEFERNVLSNEQINWNNNEQSYPNVKIETNQDDDLTEADDRSEWEADKDDYSEDDSESETDLKFEKKRNTIEKNSTKTNNDIPLVPMRNLRDWSKYEKINGKIKCSYCEKVFNGRQGVRTHEDEFHSKNPGQFVCDICGKPWNAYIRLRQHKRDVHNLRPDGSLIKNIVNCEDNIDDDKEDFKMKVYRKFKRKRRTREKKSSSEVPAKPLRDWSKYEKVNGKIKCNYCEKVFSHRKGVRVHENEFHNDTPGQFICDVCGSSWNTHARLRQHRRDVHNLRPDGSFIEKVLKYTCHICGTLFPTPSKLNRHLRTHQD